MEHGGAVVCTFSHLRVQKKKGYIFIIFGISFDHWVAPL